MEAVPRLNCAIVGEGSVFSVVYDENLTVDLLKKAIKAEKPNTIQCGASNMKLFLAKKDGVWLTENEVEGVRDTSGLKPLKFALATLPFVGLPKCDVAVREEERERLNQEAAAGNGRVHVLVVAPPLLGTVAVAPTSETKKRKLSEQRNDITPSDFATCKGTGSWVTWLKKWDGQVQCHRIDPPTDVTSLPLVLLNETFAEFEQNCRQIEFGATDCTFARDFCLAMSAPFNCENDLATKARDLLTEYLLVDNQGFTIAPATVDGSVSDGSYFFGKTLLLNLECKLQKGDGGGDPTMQNVAYYLKYMPDKIDCQYPCFLVDICGPLVSVFGVVNTSNADAICEPLVTSFPLLFFDNEHMMVSLIRVCASLKAALKKLTEECKSGATLRPSSRLVFPYKDSARINGSDVSLQYVKPIQRYVFVAEDAKGTAYIVKFAKRYGKEVHEYCAERGFAPALLHCESLPSGWIFVVMEKLSLTQLRRAGTDKMAVVHDEILNIKSSLADASLVHGDLREGNVMWDRLNNRVVLIDFDWSGTKGAYTYPPFMSNDVAWPNGAEPGKPHRIDHDAYWLDLLLSELQN